MSRHEIVRIGPAKPTWLERLRRSIGLGPFNLKDPVLARYFGGGGPTLSGVGVDEWSAMNYSAVWSAVTMISDDIASLPLMLYKRLPNGGKDRYEDHKLYELLHDSPNPEMDAMVCWRTMQTHVLVWQNAYAEIERDQVGRPVAIWPLVPERVCVERDRGGRLFYRVTNPGGVDARIDPENMIHLIGYSHDGSAGSSLVQRARESFALGLAAERFGSSFFGNGATVGGVISYPGPKPQEKTVKNTEGVLEARHQGVERAHRLLALWNGAKYEKTSVNPNEGQFNETRLFQIREVARWFKIPPHKLGDLADATYSNVEQMDAAYLTTTIRPWLVLWRQQLSRKLISRLERKQQFIEHDTHGFLHVDAAGRAALYEVEARIGTSTINEMRGYENRDPIEGGEVAMVALQNIPLSLVTRYWEASIGLMEANAEAAAREPSPNQNVPGPGDNPRSAIDALTAQIAQVKAALDEERSHRPEIETLQQQTRQAEQRASDLAEAQAEAERQRDEARAELAHAMELLNGAQTSLEAEKVEHVGTRAELVRATEDRDAAIGSRDLYKEMSAQNDAHRIGFQQKAEAQAKRAESAETSLRQALDDLQRMWADTGRLVSGLEEERDLEKAKALTAEVSLGLMTQERDEQKARADASEAKTEDALDMQERAIVMAETKGEELRRVEADKLQAEADRIAAEQRADAAERDRAIAEQAQAEANALVESRRQAESKRMLDVIASHRALMAQAIRRILAKETDRARRHQATPQKLRAWMDTYYQSEVDDMTDALLPIVRAHLAWMQSDSDPAKVAEEMAREHIDASQQQLRSVMAVEDWTQALAQTLTRWEEKRPDAVADAFVREGLAYVRTL